MEYHVVYSTTNSNHGTVGIGNHCHPLPHKRKRYEKAALQIDGLLVVVLPPKTVSDVTSDQQSIKKSLTNTPMTVSLYRMNTSEAEDGDNESLSSKDEDDGNPKEEEEEEDVEDEDDSSDTKPKKWKNQSKYKSRHKTKRKVSKKVKTTTLRRKPDIDTIHHGPTKHTMVYTGHITKLHKSGHDVMSTTPYTNFDVDDTLIMGPFQVQIVGIVTRQTKDNATTIHITHSNNEKENDTECKIDKQLRDNSKNSNEYENIRGHSIITKVPPRKIISVPLQSKRMNIITVNQNGVTTIVPKPNVKTTQSHAIPIISKVVTTKVPNAQRTHPYTTYAKVTLPVIVPKAETNSTSSLHPKVTKTMPLPLKSVRLPLRTKYTIPLSMIPTEHPTIPSNNHTNAPSDIVTKILPHIPLPASIRTVLRPHQIEGVDFIWRTLMSEKKGCILGDEMGLGKTLMTIACIVAIHRTHREKQFVVVCPSTLVVNWSNEFDKWLGPASQPKRVTIQEGGADGLQQIRAYMQKTNQSVKHQPGQVLIISYEFFRRHVNIFDCKGYTSVALLVVDEGHRLKNAGDSRTFAALASLPTDARLCITATPIQNNLCEFYNLADFCCPGILGPNVSYFRKNYERPISATNQKNATRQQLILGSAKSKELEMIVKTFMLRRLQKDVLKTMLPPRTEVLLFCRPTKIQCELYRSVCSNVTIGNSSDALTTLIMLRKICAHPALYCSPNGNESKLVPCMSNIASSGKMFVLHTLLQQIRHDASDDKVVIVSNFTSVLSLVERMILQPCSYSYLRLDGTTKDRQALVDTFNRTSVNRSFCLLLSSKAGGCGLNIIGANRLIMFDADWNPATCQQAMGRIYRQGQAKECIIYRLFTSGTVDEVILQRQLLKQGLSKLTVDSSEGSDAKFSKEELAECFDLKENCICDTKVKLGSNWPTYDPSNLSSFGCNDFPLLQVATKIPKSLCFMHINCDHAPMHDNDDLNDRCLNTCSPAGYESEGEENEFML